MIKNKPIINKKLTEAEKTIAMIPAIIITVMGLLLFGLIGGIIGGAIGGGISGIIISLLNKRKINLRYENDIDRY